MPSGCWLAAAVSGLYVVWAYDNAPGLRSTAAPAWPQQTELVRFDSKPVRFEQRLMKIDTLLSTTVTRQ